LEKWDFVQSDNFEQVMVGPDNMKERSIGVLLILNRDLAWES
jgi:hypothetical protein